MSQTAPPCTIVIFGAVGDLTKRLLIPSICNLAASDLLDRKTRIVGADHNDRTPESWRKEIGEAIHTLATGIDKDAWSFVSERLDYVRLDFTSDADFDALAERFAGEGNMLFYLAVSPGFFESISAQLARVGLLTEQADAFRRIVIEKPFGRDLQSAKDLNAHLTSLANETQLFRIDHFLGKESVAGILPLRFGSRSIGPLLNRASIASVQITAAETGGVEDRGRFYETTGALRDMVPNHLLSLLTLLTMDEPADFEPETVRDAKVALLNAVRPLGAADAVRGQYAGYREEENVAADSRIETYAALDVRIDNNRWRDVPFYLRTGKRMAAHVTTIALTLRPPASGYDPAATLPHLLLFGIDPERGIVEQFAAKRPGVDVELGPVRMGFRYDEMFDEPPNIGYETLVYDVLRGHALLFQRSDMIEREWEIVGGVLEAWGDDASEPQTYASGSAGPSDADALLARNGDRWLEVAPLSTLGRT
jgi:glucose-6-phosphate 1-dehydrogenase